MSKNTGGPAFPCLEAALTGIGSDGEERFDTEAHGGMTLRDYFAAKALPAAYNWALGQPDEDHWTLTASEAYNMADAMLAERAK